MATGRKYGGVPLTLGPERLAGRHLLVAVSGGADSVALLHLLHHSPARQHGLRLTVAHLDHGIRAGAAADAAFVRSLSRRLGIPCITGRAAVPALARQRGVSLEMAAREARYAFLLRVARRVGADRIATAHTADDQAETVLLKLIRGAGRRGLSGMRSVTRLDSIPVVRPLLAASRASIEAYLRATGIAWREDESNRDLSFLRNRVRRELLPLLEKDYNPAIRAGLLRTRDIMVAEDEWMDQQAAGLLQSLVSGGRLDAVGLAAQPLAARRRIILAWLCRGGVPAPSIGFEVIAKVDRLARSSKGNASVELEGGWIVLREYGQLKVMTAGAATPALVKPVRLKVPGVTRAPAWGLKVTVRRGPGIVRERGQGPGRLPARCSLRPESLKGRALVLRVRHEGDRIAPYGMRGSKSVQDLLVDAKVPRSQRASLPLLVCGGEVVWIPGYRIARDWAVEEDSPECLQLLVESLVP